MPTVMSTVLATVVKRVYVLPPSVLVAASSVVLPPALTP